MFEIPNPVFKLLLPVIGISAVYFITTRKLKYSFKKDLLLVTPSARNLIAWGLIWVTWMIITNMILNWRGPWNFQPWKEQSLIVSVTRFLAVVILGPLAEELVFRGVMLARLNKFKLNKWISLTIVSILWAIIHIDYSFGIITLLFFNGILLGFSLYSYRSLVIPIVLHITWNLYALW